MINNKFNISELHTLSIFHRFSEDEISLFCDVMELTTYSQLSQVITINESIDFLGIINKGEVEVSIVKNENKVVLGQLREGEIFGELSLFDNLSASANVTAIVPAEIFIIRKEPLKKLLDDNEKIAVKFYRNLFSMITQRLRATSSSLASHDYLLSQLKTKNNELEMINLKLNQLTELNSKYLGFATDDIINPISTIMGLLAILSSGTLGSVNENQRDIIKQIRDEALFIQNLLNDLINIGKIESGKTEMIKEELDLVDSVIKVSEIYKPIAHQKRINFIIKRPLDLFPSVEADPQQIREVLNNIYSNALKYCAPLKRIETFFEKRETEIVVHIRDEGPGISESEIESIFNPFNKINGKSDREHSIGLSLPISKKIIELHGGRIWITSKLGEGTTVSFAIPFLS